MLFQDILQVGKEVVKDRHDRLAIIAAIRARLARKSLPMVSADGLVVYGLQVSPTAQITTGMFVFVKNQSFFKVNHQSLRVSKKTCDSFYILAMIDDLFFKIINSIFE